MAKGRATAAAADPNPLPLGPTDEEELVDEQDAEDIESVYLQIEDAEATVTIKRRDPDDAKVWQYLVRIPARLFSLEQIKLEYGGGEYKVQAFDKRGKIVAGGPRLFHIDKVFRPKGAAGPGPSDNGAGVRTVSPDVAALSAKVDQLAALLTAQNSSKETLDMAIRMATVMSGGASRGNLSPESVLNILKTGVDLRDRFGGEGGGEGGGGGGGGESEGDMFGSALRELVRPVARLLETEVERRAARPRVPPAGGTQPPTRPPEEPVSGNAPPWLRQLAPWIPQLLTLAREGANPRLYAEVVVDRMDRSLTAATIAAIEQAAQDDGFVNMVMGALPPACQQYGEWFRALVTQLKEELTRPDEAEAEEVAGGPLS